MRETENAATDSPYISATHYPAQVDDAADSTEWLARYDGLGVEEAQALAEREGRRLRVVGPDGAMTMDHDPRRVTVWTDAEGRPKRVSAG